MLYRKGWKWEEIVLYQYLPRSTQFSLQSLELFLHLIWFLTIVLNRCPVPAWLSSHDWLLPMQVPADENNVSSSLAPFSFRQCMV